MYLQLIKHENLADFVVNYVNLRRVIQMIRPHGHRQVFLVREKIWIFEQKHLCNTEPSRLQGYIAFMHVYLVLVCIYHSLVIKGPWAEYLTSLPKRGVGALSTVSAFNHERAPTSCLQRLEVLDCTQNNVQRNHQWLRGQFLTARKSLNGTMWQWA